MHLWNCSALHYICMMLLVHLTRNSIIMTVLLKNLFTVHFQFDLLKLETNNTREDETNHAWIIARWTMREEIFLWPIVATSWDEYFSFDPQACNLNGPPYQPPQPTPHPPTPKSCISDASCHFSYLHHVFVALYNYIVVNIHWLVYCA